MSPVLDAVTPVGKSIAPVGKSTAPVDIAYAPVDINLADDGDDDDKKDGDKKDDPAVDPVPVVSGGRRLAGLPFKPGKVNIMEDPLDLSNELPSDYRNWASVLSQVLLKKEGDAGTATSALARVMLDVHGSLARAANGEPFLPRFHLEEPLLLAKDGGAALGLPPLEATKFESSASFISFQPCVLSESYDGLELGATGLSFSPSLISIVNELWANDITGINFNPNVSVREVEFLGARGGTKRREKRAETKKLPKHPIFRFFRTSVNLCVDLRRTNPTARRQPATGSGEWVKKKGADQLVRITNTTPHLFTTTPLHQIYIGAIGANFQPQGVNVNPALINVAPIGTAVQPTGRLIAPAHKVFGPTHIGYGPVKEDTVEGPNPRIDLVDVVKKEGGKPGKKHP